MSQARLQAGMPGANPSASNGNPMTSSMSYGGAGSGQSKPYILDDDEIRNEDGTWPELPTKMAEQLRDGSRDSVSPEYRKQVEAYFEAIAAKSRSSQKEKN